MANVVDPLIRGDSEWKLPSLALQAEFGTHDLLTRENDGQNDVWRFTNYLELSARGPFPLPSELTEYWDITYFASLNGRTTEYSGIDRYLSLQIGAGASLHPFGRSEDFIAKIDLDLALAAYFGDPVRLPKMTFRNEDTFWMSAAVHPSLRFLYMDVATGLGIALEGSSDIAPLGMYFDTYYCDGCNWSTKRVTGSYRRYGVEALAKLIYRPWSDSSHKYLSGIQFMLSAAHGWADLAYIYPEDSSRISDNGSTHYNIFLAGIGYGFNLNVL